VICQSKLKIEARRMILRIDVYLFHQKHALNTVEKLLTQCVIRAASLQDLSLLVKREVLVHVFRVDILLVQIEDFVVRDSSGVAEVVDACAVGLVRV
jgi:hypothetical protein